MTDATPPQPVVLETGKAVGPNIAEELGELTSLPFSFSGDGRIEFGASVSAADQKKIAAVFKAHDPDKPSRADITRQLEEIDAKKIRAYTDAMLSKDTTRLTELEKQAVALRKQLTA